MESISVLPMALPEIEWVVISYITFISLALLSTKSWRKI